VAPQDATAAMAALKAQGESVYQIGRIAARAPGQPQTVVN
jgi:phosphoribosylaminoimidazole (AIR) synthetase